LSIAYASFSVLVGADTIRLVLQKLSEIPYFYVLSFPTSPDSSGIAASGLALQVEKTCGSWRQQ